MAIPTKASARQGRNRHEQHFKALAAFANAGDEPEDWEKFRSQNPQFFPAGLTAWIYKAAKDLATEGVVGGEQFPGEVKKLAFATPLLVYRDFLRAVWTRNDPDGVALTFLLGFEGEAVEKRAAAERGLMVIRPTIPGESTNPEQQTIGGLPRGRPVVNGVTGEITWEFGCALQQAVYELMQQRWRAMVCPQCGKYFVAAKTAQKHCSPRCYHEFKNKRSLDYWHREGSAKRDQRLKKAKFKPRRRAR